MVKPWGFPGFRKLEVQLGWCPESWSIRNWRFAELLCLTYSWKLYGRDSWENLRNIRDFDCRKSCGDQVWDLDLKNTGCVKRLFLTVGILISGRAVGRRCGSWNLSLSSFSMSLIYRWKCNAGQFHRRYQTLDLDEKLGKKHTESERIWGHTHGGKVSFFNFFMHTGGEFTSCPGFKRSGILNVGSGIPNSSLNCAIRSWTVFQLEIWVEITHCLIILLFQDLPRVLEALGAHESHKEQEEQEDFHCECLSSTPGFLLPKSAFIHCFHAIKFFALSLAVCVSHSHTHSISSSHW